jgi:hypothetical protein
MKIWQKSRKLKNLSLAVHSAIAFTKAGQRFRHSLLTSAKEAQQLEKDGIDWRLTSTEIQQAKKKNLHNRLLDVDPHSQVTYSASMSEH